MVVLRRACFVGKKGHKSYGRFFSSNHFEHHLFWKRKCSFFFSCVEKKFFFGGKVIFLGHHPFLEGKVLKYSRIGVWFFLEQKCGEIKPVYVVYYVLIQVNFRQVNFRHVIAKYYKFTFLVKKSCFLTPKKSKSLKIYHIVEVNKYFF